MDDLLQGMSAAFHEIIVRPLAQFVLGLGLSDMVVVSVLVGIGIAVGIVIGHFRGARSFRISRFQNRSEALVSRVIQSKFGPPDYHLMNHVTIQMDDGTTQIDHILVSRFGVFVIETKHYKGWIFANAGDKTWTQVLFRLKFRFQNPIHQNLRHVRAVQNLLEFLPYGAIKPVVIFTGEAEFKTEIPQGVFSLSEFVDYVAGETEEVMSLNRVQFCVGRLETSRLAISGQTDVQHIESLKRRHSRVA